MQPTPLPEENTVAYFVHLHADTAEKMLSDCRRRGESLFRVFGKARPVLVLRKLPKKARDRVWFVVLPVFSAREKAGTHGMNMWEIGGCIDGDKQSWVLLEPIRVPDSLFVNTVRRCNQLELHNVWKILNHKLMKGWVTLLGR